MRREKDLTPPALGCTMSSGHSTTSVRMGNSKESRRAENHAIRAHLELVGVVSNLGSLCF